MESTKTTKITISLSRQEIEILEKAQEVIQALSDKAQEGYDTEEADEVVLVGLTNTILDDLYSMIDDITGLCKQVY